MVNGFDIELVVKSDAIETVYKCWGPFRIYQIIIKANPAPFEFE